MDCPNCQEMDIDGKLDAQEEDNNIPETSSEDTYMWEYLILNEKYFRKKKLPILLKPHYIYCYC